MLATAYHSRRIDDCEQCVDQGRPAPCLRLRLSFELAGNPKLLKMLHRPDVSTKPYYKHVLGRLREEQITSPNRPCAFCRSTTRDFLQQNAFAATVSTLELDPCLRCGQECEGCRFICNPKQRSALLRKVTSQSVNLCDFKAVNVVHTLKQAGPVLKGAILEWQRQFFHNAVSERCHGVSALAVAVISKNSRRASSFKPLMS